MPQGKRHASEAQFNSLPVVQHEARRQPRLLPHRGLAIGGAHTSHSAHDTDLPVRYSSAMNSREKKVGNCKTVVTLTFEPRVFGRHMHLLRHARTRSRSSSYGGLAHRRWVLLRCAQALPHLPASLR